MNIILKTWSSDENYNGNCDFAVVTLSPSLARLALKRIGTLTRLRAKDDTITEIRYNDQSVNYISYEVLEEHGYENLPRIPQTETWHTPGDLQLPEENYQATDRDEMVVSVGCKSSYVHWNSSPRNSGVEVETDAIPLGVLQAAARIAEVIPSQEYF